MLPELSKHYPSLPELVRAHTPTTDRKGNMSTLNIISEALVSGRLAVFHYDALDGETGVRVVSVEELRHTKAGSVVFTGVDYVRDEYRSFRLERASDALLTVG